MKYYRNLPRYRREAPGSQQPCGCYGSGTDNRNGWCGCNGTQGGDTTYHNGSRGCSNRMYGNGCDGNCNGSQDGESTYTRTGTYPSDGNGDCYRTRTYSGDGDCGCSCDCNCSAVPDGTGDYSRNSTYYNDGHHDFGRNCCDSCENAGDRRMQQEVHVMAPLAMAYVPWQCFREIYTPCDALGRGTLYRELDLPYIDSMGGGYSRG